MARQNLYVHTDSPMICEAWVGIRETKGGNWYPVTCKRPAYRALKGGGEHQYFIPICEEHIIKCEIIRAEQEMDLDE